MPTDESKSHIHIILLPFYITTKAIISICMPYDGEEFITTYKQTKVNMYYSTVSFSFGMQSHIVESMKTQLTLRYK